MTWRINALFLFFVILFLAVIIRLFYWQVVRAEELSELGQSQYGREIKLTPKRGEIKTSDGFPIAANKISYLLFANPKEIKDQLATVDTLATLLDMDPATISAQLSREDKFWVPVKSQIPYATKKAIEDKKIKGLGFEEQFIRFYPEASTAAKILGFVGKNQEGENAGYFGLEGYYDRQLKGKTTLAMQIYDALGRPILARMSKPVGEVDGRNLVLHISRPLQFMLEQEVKTGVEKYGAAGGMAAIMDPKTGGILAMAAYPSYDPREYYEYSDVLYKNPFITDTYEPGSTFKPLIMASAIESNLITHDTRCTICEGPVEIGGYTIKTWNDEYHPNLTMKEVIQYSDNTGMVFIGQKLGLDLMISYFDKLGIGQATGIDLQGEVTPMIRERDSWYPIDLATASFGQGVSITPIELLSAFSSLANGGKRMQPHVVSAVETEDGEKIPIEPKVLSTPFSEKTTKVVTEVLVNAVDAGEAKWAKPKGYRIAGKTGTAQIPVAGHYDPNKTIASFIGFAPADDPRFVMLVVIDRPTTSIYGSETAAPMFFSIAKNILNFYGIAPTENE